MKKVLKVIGWICLVLASIAVLFIGKGFSLYQEAITMTPIKEKVEQVRQKENFTAINELPRIYTDAVISTEDHRFYSHSGIDIIGIGRAVLHDIQAWDFVEGGSTITQQVAKNMYFSQEKKITRKIAEVFLAFDLEKQYTKKEILELYLNTSYFGEGCYTVKEATRIYFAKEPNQMTPKEAIMLAGIPNAPSVYAPTRNLELAKKRQLQVANQMVRHGYLTQEEKNKILQ